MMSCSIVSLTRRGVSDYLIGPVGTLDVVRAICGLFSSRRMPRRSAGLSRSSAPRAALALRPWHTIRWAIGRDLALDSVVADLDLAFGTAGLDYNQDPPQGIADAVFSPDRVDTGVHRPLAVEMHGPFESAGGAGHSGSRLRLRRRCLRYDARLRCAAPSRAWSSMFRINGRPGPSGFLSSADDILVAPAPTLPTCAMPRTWSICCAPRVQTITAALLPQSGGRAETAGNHAGRFREGAGKRSARGDSVRATALRSGREQRPDDRRGVGWP